MMTELFVENNKLDINSDLSSLLTFAIDDVKDFSTRQTTFSKTIVIPGTANNNKIFGHIFDIGISNNYDPAQTNIGYNFNPSVSAKCIMFQDYLQTFKGTLRLLEIVKDKHRIEYEVALNGTLTSLSVAFSSAYLTDLDFSAYNSSYSIANITGSWSNSPGSGVYFPMIDYGTYSIDKHNWAYGTFRPALYVKEYIDKMFAAASFRYSSALFNTGRFKRLIVPHNQKRLTKQGNTLLTGSRFTDYIASFGDVGESGSTNYKFETISSSVFTVSGGNSIFTYTEATAQTITVAIEIKGVYRAPDTVFSIGLFRNTEIVPLQRIDLDNAASDTPYDLVFNVTLTINNGDYLAIRITNPGSSSEQFSMYSNYASIVVNTPSNVAIPVLLNDTIDINAAIPQNIKQVDFLVSIVKLFNLYVYEDKFDERLIRITPFIDFYSIGSGSSVDWTYKLNRNSPIKIKPMSELNSRTYNYNYKDDSDYWNDLYKKRYNQGYGSYIFDSQFEFASQTNKLELIFASTPLVGYTGEEKVYPTILKQTGNAPSVVEENIDSVIRIMQTKKITGVSSWSIYSVAQKAVNGGLSASGGNTSVTGISTKFTTDLAVGDYLYVSIGLLGQVSSIADDTHLTLVSGATTSVTNVFFSKLPSGSVLASLTSYGYAGHFDDPDAPDNDLNFGPLNELFFVLTAGDLTKTQFNLYWSSYMAEITDKDSKLLTARFYLTPKDIADLDFSKYVYVDGILFRLNKITDYNATIPSDCEVQLLKVIQTSYSFPPAIPADDMIMLYSSIDVDAMPTGDDYHILENTDDILYD